MVEVNAVLLTPPFEELAVHWLDPPRPALAEARAVVGTAATPAQAWDRVRAAGLLPGAWATGFHTMRGAAVRHRYGNCRTEQCRQPCPVGRFEPDPLPTELAVQHRELVAQGEDLHVLVPVTVRQ